MIKISKQALISFLWLTITSANIYCCEIYFYPKLVLINDSGLTPDDLIQKTDCSKTISDKVSKLLLGLGNSVPAEYLRTIFEQDNKTEAPIIRPNVVIIQKLSEIIEREISKQGETLKISNLKPANGRHLISMNESEQINLDCIQCETTGNKNLRLTINDTLTAKTYELWFSMKILAKGNALYPKTDITFGGISKSLSNDQFIKKEIFIENPEYLFTDQENIEFYAQNKLLKKNSPVLTTDLMPKDLVTYGNPAKVIFQTNQLILTNMAIPTRSGKLGDVIQLKAVRTDALVLGKVIGFNKVLVEL